MNIAGQQIVGVDALGASLFRREAAPWGSLRVDDSAAELNSMLCSFRKTWNPTASGGGDVLRAMP